MIPHVINSDGLVMIFEGKGISIDSGDKRFGTLRSLLKAGDDEGVVQYMQDPNLAIIKRFTTSRDAPDLMDVLKKRFSELGDDAQARLTRFLGDLCAA